jgi:hypothetical protein
MALADTDALFRWALEILPFRNKLDESRSFLGASRRDWGGP